MNLLKLSYVCWVLAIVVEAKVVIESTKNGVILTKIKTGDDKPKWWQTATIYQIYPASFKDDVSWHPGAGDILGIVQKMPYLKETGITAILLSPFLTSFNFYEGDEIIDSFSMEPMYGSENAIRNLIKVAKDHDIKVIVDFVPNHTSDQHKWFRLSADRIKEFTDMYVWHNGTVDKDGNRSPPNNWKSVVSINESAWTWHEKRGQWYLHQFNTSQPDLNFRNAKVINEIKLSLQYWLDYGFDGFSFRFAEFLFEDEQFRNETSIDSIESSLTDYNSLDHTYTRDLNETYQMIYEFRELIDNYTREHKTEDRILIVEINTTLINSIKYCVSDDDQPKGAHFFQNLDFINNLSKDTVPVDIMDMTIKWWGFSFYLNYTWMLGNYESHRLANRVGSENVDGYNMLLPLFEGTQITYSGEEIGMENGPVTCKQGQDPVAIKDCSTFDKISRDFQRTPFQWDDSLNAGFNNGYKTWLPVNPNYLKLNLAAQQNVSNSHYEIYRKMQKIKDVFRKDHQTASWSLSRTPKNILQCYRFARDVEVAYSFDLIFNMGNATETIVLEAPEDSFFEVLVVSGNSSRKIGEKLLGNRTQAIAGHEAILLSGPWMNNGTNNILVEFSFVDY